MNASSVWRAVVATVASFTIGCGTDTADQNDR